MFFRILITLQFNYVYFMATRYLRLAEATAGTPAHHRNLRLGMQATHRIELLQLRWPGITDALIEARARKDYTHSLTD